MKRWRVDGDPRGIAVVNGIAYLGLAGRQSIIAIDPETGSLLRERVLDHEEIASTKEIVSLRANGDGSRLVAANGSDESVTIVTVPELEITREILLEGEMVHDAVPDPSGKHLFVLGSKVHVFDGQGTTEIRTLPDERPSAIALSSDGTMLAVISRERFGDTDAAIVTLYETATLKELVREPLQTDRDIRAAFFGANDRSLVVLASDWLAEKQLVQKKAMAMSDDNGKMRIRFDFGDLVSSESICLAKNSGPQIGAIGAGSTVIHFAERRCSSNGTFTSAPRKVASASLYNVEAFAIAYDKSLDRLYASEPAGYLTIYRSPQPPTSR